MGEERALLESSVMGLDREGLDALNENEPAHTIRCCTYVKLELLS